MMAVTELKDYGRGSKGIIKYLTDSIADENPIQPNSISGSTRYYTNNGTPPGVWLGSGINAFAGINSGDMVSTSQLENLIGFGKHPDTGEQLGSAFKTVIPKTIDEEFIAQVEEYRAEAPAVAKRILHKYFQANAKPNGSVHGFDFTFSPAKDISLLWGLGDNGVREIVEKAHHDAINRTLARLEATALYTREGSGGKNQVKTRGLIAARYDHWDTREGDPHLHSHVVVANKVQTQDGKWLTIDSRGGVFPSAVAISEYYDNILMDILTARLGVAWEIRSETRSGKPIWGIQGIDESLIQEFSTRHRKIVAARTESSNRKDDKAAWDKTRRAKKRASLEQLRELWATRAGKTHLDDVCNLDAAGRGLATPQDLAEQYKQQLGHIALQALEKSKSNWSRWNVVAEVERAAREVRLAYGRDEVVEEISDNIMEGMIELNPDQPTQYRRWSTQRILDAEILMLDTSNTYLAKGIDHQTVVTQLDQWRSDDGWALSRTQAMAAWEILTSNRTCDLLVGPAGAGKTTTLSGLVDVWRQNGGEVYGYAPSAVAAKVLKESTGDANTLASWIHSQHRPEFDKNTLVIIDEASMSGTLELAEITQAVRDKGGKILLVGDPNQLNAVEVGGAFAMLTREHPTPPSLSEVHRFKNPWEAEASLALRTGKDLSVVATYLKNERIKSGPAQTIETQMFAAWWNDTSENKESLMLAGDNETVTRLNQAAQNRLIEAGKVQANGQTITLHDATQARLGDKIVTRRNARKTIHDEVINGATFQIRAINKDGTLLVSPIGKDILLTLPAQYVTQHVDLGYAGTIHRAQGRTVDTCHTLISDTTTANGLYVGMTRGKNCNTAWAITSTPASPDGPTPQEISGIQIFTQAIQNREDNRTAIELFQKPARQEETPQMVATIHPTPPPVDAYPELQNSGYEL